MGNTPPNVAIINISLPEDIMRYLIYHNPDIQPLMSRTCKHYYVWYPPIQQWTKIRNLVDQINENLDKNVVFSTFRMRTLLKGGDLVPTLIRAELFSQLFLDPRISLNFRQFLLISGEWNVPLPVIIDSIYLLNISEISDYIEFLINNGPSSFGYSLTTRVGEIIASTTTIDLQDIFNKLIAFASCISNMVKYRKFGDLNPSQKGEIMMWKKYIDIVVNKSVDEWKDLFIQHQEKIAFFMSILKHGLVVIELGEEPALFV